MNNGGNVQRNGWAHNVVPVRHQQLLKAAAVQHNAAEIDVITDQLVALGLVRPRSCAALQMLSSRLGKAAPDPSHLGGRVL
jgi:hypothetical protein